MEIPLLAPPSMEGHFDDTTALQKFSLHLNEREELFHSHWAKFANQHNLPSLFQMSERYDFGRMRMAIPRFYALGYDRWELLTLAFGFTFPFHTPISPFECYNKQDISEELWQLLLKRARQNRIQFVPKTACAVILPVFELYSSGKTRMIQDSRWVNCFLEAETFQLPSHKDALKSFDQHEYLFVLDFSSFWSQLAVAPSHRFNFGSAVVYKGQHYYFVYTGISFGNRMGPYLATKILQKACNIFSLVCPGVRFIDDATGRLAAFSAPQNVLDLKSHFCAEFWSRLGVQLNKKTFFEPRLAIDWCGKMIYSPLHQAFPLVKKFFSLYELIKEVCSSGRTSPRQLAAILGTLQSLTDLRHPDFLRTGYHLIAKTLAKYSSTYSQADVWDVNLPISRKFGQCCLKWIQYIANQQCLHFPLVPRATIILATDAGNKKIGCAIFLKTPNKVTFLHALSENLPTNLAVQEQCLALAPSSIVREAYAACYAVLYALTVWKVQITKLHLDSLIIETDSLGFAFAWHSTKTRDPFVSQCLRLIRRHLREVNLPATIHWKGRENPNQRIADLLSKLDNLSPTSLLKRRIIASLHLATWPASSPYHALDFLQFKIQRSFQKNFCIIIVPPHLSIRAYESILHTLYTRWEGKLLLLLPFFRNNNVYIHCGLTTMPGPTFPCNPQYFEGLLCPPSQTLIYKAVLLHASKD